MPRPTISIASRWCFPCSDNWPKRRVPSAADWPSIRLPRPGRSGQAPGPESPHRMQARSQIWFDPMLRELAETFPTVRLRYRCRLDSFVETGAAVTVRVTDLAGGDRETIQADYLVGCDGAASTVRRALGIELE